MFSAQSVSLFLATERIQAVRKERRIQTIQRSFHSENIKAVRALYYEQLVPDGDFLHTKINNKDVYVVYGATEDIPEYACSLRQYQYRQRFGSIQLKQVTKVLKTKYQNVSTFSQLSLHVSFGVFIFIPWFWQEMQNLILVFPPISQLLPVVFSLAVLLTFLQILDRWLLLLYCQLYSQLNWLEKIH